MEGFSLSFGQMFASVRQCAELITQPCRLKVKVTIEGNNFEPLISCPLHIYFTPGRIFLNLCQMFVTVRQCAESITQPCQLKVNDTIEGHEFEPLISCSLHISFTPGRIFI